MLAGAAGHFQQQPASRQQALQFSQDGRAVAFGGRAVAAGVFRHGELSCQCSIPNSAPLGIRVV
jgi:hypothetical protein